MKNFLIRITLPLALFFTVLGCSNSLIEDDLALTSDYPSIRFTTVTSSATRGTTTNVKVSLSKASSRNVSVSIRMQRSFPGFSSNFTYFAVDSTTGSAFITTATVLASTATPDNPTTALVDTVSDVVFATSENVVDRSVISAGVRVPVFTLTIPAGQTEGFISFTTRVSNPVSGAGETVRLLMLPSGNSGASGGNVVGNAFIAPSININDVMVHTHTITD